MTEQNEIDQSIPNKKYEYLDHTAGKKHQQFN